MLNKRGFFCTKCSVLNNRMLNDTELNLIEATKMKKLIAIPTFDKNGILEGIEVIDRISLPDEVTIGNETIEITGRGISELQQLPEIIFDVRDTEEPPRLALPATESRIARARLFLRNSLAGHFMSKETNRATSLR